ncbi:hypothetical protein GF386_06580 [Candidatus Pacearchaeota archaeon]|nr:hypothetical protein [Candidatus Pacearchaeota archaeon]MBD3283760.1 hypothetical protein [Candidatus Pacearchaeota archaeon]
MSEAFEAVYSSGNFDYIDRFEKFVLGITQRAVQGEGELEAMIAGYESGKPLTERPETTVSEKRKPRLTSYQYQKSRDQGMTHEQIREKFRVDSGRQLCGFASQYARRQREKEKDKRPVLNLDLYERARNEGMTHQEIRDSEKFRIDDPRSLRGYASAYAKRHSQEQETLETSKPELTFEEYEHAISQGLSTSDIREAYHVTSSQQLSGFSRKLANKKSKKSRARAKK